MKVFDLTTSSQGTQREHVQKHNRDAISKSQTVENSTEQMAIS